MWPSHVWVFHPHATPSTGRPSKWRRAQKTLRSSLPQQMGWNGCPQRDSTCVPRSALPPALLQHLCRRHRHPCHQAWLLACSRPVTCHKLQCGGTMDPQAIAPDNLPAAYLRRHTIACDTPHWNLRRCSRITNGTSLSSTSEKWSAAGQRGASGAQGKLHRLGVGPYVSKRLGAGQPGAEASGACTPAVPAVAAVVQASRTSHQLLE